MPAYFVQDLFPLNRTSLICGPSGAGKTHWLLPTIANWLEGRDVLGKRSFPLPCGYIACDRPSESTHEMIENLGLAERLKPMKIVSLMDGTNSFNYPEIAIRHFPPGSVKVLFIEAFQALIPEGKINDYWTVLNFFRRWNQFCKIHNYSILASAHSPKMHEDGSYVQQRDKIMGSVAWGAATETIILIEPSAPKDIDCTLRNLTVLPRLERNWSIELDFDKHNHLIESTSSYDLACMILEQEVTKLSPTRVLSTADIVDMAEARGLSESTAKRWLKNTPVLRRIRQGRYQLSLPS